ncbi:hypothetical protein FKM82_012149 [Ascaphus truei]
MEGIEKIRKKKRSITGYYSSRILDFCTSRWTSRLSLLRGSRIDWCCSWMRRMSLHPGKGPRDSHRNTRHSSGGSTRHLLHHYPDNICGTYFWVELEENEEMVSLQPNPSIFFCGLVNYIFFF